jgi:hypothetical protein
LELWYLLKAEKIDVLFFCDTFDMSSDLQHNMDPVKVEPDSEPVSSVADHSTHIKGEAHPTAVSLPIKCAVMVSYAIYPQTLKTVSLLILAATSHVTNIKPFPYCTVHCIILSW